MAHFGKRNPIKPIASVIRAPEVSYFEPTEQELRHAKRVMLDNLRARLIAR